MYFDLRLWQFTKGVRSRIAGAVMIGLLAAALGIARLALLGWLLAKVFRGEPLDAMMGRALGRHDHAVHRGRRRHRRGPVAAEALPQLPLIGCLAYPAVFRFVNFIWVDTNLSGSSGNG